MTPFLVSKGNNLSGRPSLAFSTTTSRGHDSSSTLPSARPPPVKQLTKPHMVKGTAGMIW